MHSLTDIKYTITSIVRDFRGLYLLTSDEVKIDEFRKEEGKYIVKGAYEARSFTGATIESGEFYIELDEELNPLKVNIKPKVS